MSKPTKAKASPWLDEWHGQPISYAGHTLVCHEAERLHNTAVIRVCVHGEDPESVTRDLVGAWIENSYEGEPMSAESLRAESIIAMVRRVVVAAIEGKEAKP